MDGSHREQAELLQGIVSAIAPSLGQTEVADLQSFIDAREFGLATDTIFCAIAEDDILVDDDLLSDLSSIRHLFNTFGDLDPAIVTNVLARTRQPSVAVR